MCKSEAPSSSINWRKSWMFTTARTSATHCREQATCRRATPRRRGLRADTASPTRESSRFWRLDLSSAAALRIRHGDAQDLLDRGDAVGDLVDSAPPERAHPALDRRALHLGGRRAGDHGL